MKLAKIKKKYLVAAAALGVGAMICLPRVASAAVAGVCYNCHTMHNSQNNAPMTYNGSATPNDNLLRGNCLTCHTGTNDGSNVRPYVYSTTDPTYGPTGATLAGGNFYWCVNGGGADGGGDPVAIGGGHDVNFLGVNDAVLLSPPGYSDSTVSWSARETAEGLATARHLTCAGTAGCHGDRSATNNFSAVHGAHHSDSGGVKAGATVAGSFRFLLGVTGTEVSGWEYQAAVGTAHNGYQGTARTSDATGVTIPTLVSGTNTTLISISQLCAECHGAFHNSAGSFTYADGTSGVSGIVGSNGWGSPWIRHPTDFDMSTLTGEYANYTTYDPMVPVGRTGAPATTWTTDDTVHGATNGAVVMCISCHRAHGSPYADLLRWNYSTMVAGGGAPSGSLGCFTCHSDKD